MPTVSVSIITYNQAAYVAEAIDSVLAQETDFDVEVLIGDDCSTDGTQSILESYRDRYPDKIVLNLHAEKGGGVPGRINNVTNLTACRGEFVAMLDGDDYWCDTGKLQRQVDLLRQRPELSGAAHDSQIYDQADGRMRKETFSSRIVGQTPRRNRDLDQATFATPLLFQVSSFCFRRSMLRSFPDWFMDVPAADLALYLILTEAGPIHYESTCSSVYRMHKHGVFNRLDRAARSRFLIDSWRYFFEHAPRTRTRKALAAVSLQHAMLGYVERDPLRVVRYGATALFLNPPELVQAARRRWSR